MADVPTGKLGVNVVLEEVVVPMGKFGVNVVFVVPTPDDNGKVGKLGVNEVLGVNDVLPVTGPKEIFGVVAVELVAVGLNEKLGVNVGFAVVVAVLIVDV